MSSTALVLAALLAAGGPAQPVVIGTFRIEPWAKLEAGQIALELGDYASRRYGELSRRHALLSNQGGVLRIDWSKLNRPAPEPAGKNYRRCTFLIDCDDRSVLRVQSELVERYGAKPTPRQLETFVGEYIKKKSLAYGMTPASTPARTREGDCTEHAVLLAALARASGYAARFVSGLALVKGPAMHGQLAAYGHAWTEIHDGQRFRRYDAALVLVAGAQKSPDICLSYVPVRVMQDEGPGFGGRGGFDVLYVQRVLVNAEFASAAACP